MKPKDEQDMVEIGYLYGGMFVKLDRELDDVYLGIGMSGKVVIADETGIWKYVDVGNLVLEANWDWKNVGVVKFAWGPRTRTCWWL